jgi:PAS domain-containing protein
MSVRTHGQQDELARKAAILELTLDAMDQGISVFDADLKVVVFNRRFLEILRLPADRFRVGDSFETFIRYNAERGDYGPGDVDAQVRSRVELARRCDPHCFERTRPDGTVIEIRGTPMSGGGFLTTYTDITERKRSEGQALQRALDAARAQLDATLESVSAGIGLFDWDDRLVLCNSHYREVYPGLADVIQIGTTFEHILRTAADRSIVADAIGRRETWFEERLARHRNPSGPFQQQQVDGRWVQIDERRTADGGVVAVFTDVSELKRREEDLAAAVRDKDALLAEFNTVMDTICFSGRTCECGWPIAPSVRCGTFPTNSSLAMQKCGN